MAWAAWGNWYQKPERNRASRMSCEQAKAHAMIGRPRWFMIGDDNRAHVVGTMAGLCGVALLGWPIGGVYQHCDECKDILQEIERVTA